MKAIEKKNFAKRIVTLLLLLMKVERGENLTSEEHLERIWSLTKLKEEKFIELDLNFVDGAKCNLLQNTIDFQNKFIHGMNVQSMFEDALECLKDHDTDLNAGFGMLLPMIDWMFCRVYPQRADELVVRPKKKPILQQKLEKNHAAVIERNFSNNNEE